MTREEMTIARHLCELAYKSSAFVSGDTGYVFAYGQLRQMNNLDNEHFYTSSVCVDVQNIFEHGIDFVGTEDEVWRKTQLLNYK